jgi:hypothetical protein
MTEISPPRHIVWSTDKVDLSDDVQRTWYRRQVLMHGNAQDIRTLNLGEVERLLDELHLPLDLHGLWARFLEMKGAARYGTPVPDSASSAVWMKKWRSSAHAS